MKKVIEGKKKYINYIFVFQISITLFSKYGQRVFTILSPQRSQGCLKPQQFDRK